MAPAYIASPGAMILLILVLLMRCSLAGPRKLLESGGYHDHPGHLVHHVASETDIVMSVMLLGAMLFNMTLFYLVNYEDPDVRYYAWSVLSSTICIFTALLMFNGLDGVIDAYLREHFVIRGAKLVLLDYFVMLLFLIAQQLLIMYASGVHKTSCIAQLCHLPMLMSSTVGPDAASSGFMRRMSTRKKLLEDSNLLTEAWASLTAHMAGFASIYAAGAWQHIGLFSQSPLRVLLVVPLHLAVLAGLFCLSAFFRDVARSEATSPATKLWYEATVNSEDEVAALSLSFLVVQGLRFQFSGQLPNREGEELIQQTQSTAAIAGLFATSLGFGLLTLLPVKCAGSGSSHQQEASRPACRRVIKVMEASCSMAFAWCIFFATKWVQKALQPDWDTNSMVPRTTLALALSAGAVVVIICLDYIVDMPETEDEVDEALKKIISGLGLLVGFAWEQAFEGAAHSLASQTQDPVRMKVCIATAVAITVIPAWRWYILTNVQEARPEAKEAHHFRRSLRSSQSKLTNSSSSAWLQGPSGRSSSRCLDLTEPKRPEASSISYERLHLNESDTLGVTEEKDF